MRIALVQQHASHDREENTARGAAAVLIVFPELSFVRFFPQKQRYQQPL